MNHRVCLLLPLLVSPVYSSHVILFPEKISLEFSSRNIINICTYTHIYVYVFFFLIQIIAYSFLSLKNIGDSFLSLHAHIIFSGYIVFLLPEHFIFY